MDIHELKKLGYVEEIEDEWLWVAMGPPRPEVVEEAVLEIPAAAGEGQAESDPEPAAAVAAPDQEATSRWLIIMVTILMPTMAQNPS